MSDATQLLLWIYSDECVRSKYIFIKKVPFIKQLSPPFSYHPSDVSGISHHAVLLRDHDQQDGFVRLKHE